MIGADLKTGEEMENKEASKYFVFKEKSLANFQSRVLKFRKRKICTNMMDIPRKEEQWPPSTKRLWNGH